MKRIKIQTQKPFKRGDVRQDGKVFRGYTNQLKSNGFFKEIWVDPKKLETARVKDKEKKRLVYSRNPNRLPYGSAKLFKANPKAVEVYWQFTENPPSEKDWVWLDEDLQWLRKYFTL